MHDEWRKLKHQGKIERIVNNVRVSHFVRDSISIANIEWKLQKLIFTKPDNKFDGESLANFPKGSLSAFDGH